MLEGMEHDALDAGFPRAEMMAVAAAFQYKPVKCPKAVKEDLADFTADPSGGGPVLYLPVCQGRQVKPVPATGQRRGRRAAR